MQEPDSCSSIFLINTSGSFPLYGPTTLSLYSFAASSGSKFATTRFGTSSISTPLLFKVVEKTSCKFDAGSVLTSMIFFPWSASVIAVAQAVEVFPTPPLPVKNKYLVSLISFKSNLFKLKIPFLF
ncbi:hypothetical protein D3C81_1268450 [compost metagenome]